MRSVGLVSVLLCGGGPVHSFDHLPIPPLLCAPTTTARPWPFAHVFRGTQSPLQPVMLCVASHKCQCHRGTVINFGALGKMSSRCLFGLSFPTPLATPPPPSPRSPACLGVTGRELQAHTSSHHAPAVTQSQPPPLLGGGGDSSSSWRHKTLPDLTMIFFSDHSQFLNPLAVC